MEGWTMTLGQSRILGVRNYVGNYNWGNPVVPSDGNLRWSCRLHLLRFVNCPQDNSIVPVTIPSASNDLLIMKAGYLATAAVFSENVVAQCKNETTSFVQRLTSTTSNANNY